MSSTSGQKQSQLIFQDKLRKKLKAAVEYPTTVMIASSGYGKTVAIKECFYKEMIGENDRVINCILSAGNPIYLWNQLVDKIEEIDEDCGRKLEILGFPKETVEVEIIDCIRQMKCSQNTYLLIDNFHCILSYLSEGMIEALLEREESALHLIILSRELLIRETKITGNHRINVITSNTLAFEEETIRDLFEKRGIRLEEGSVKALRQDTFGLAAALQVQCNFYLENGSFLSERCLEQLMEELFQTFPLHLKGLLYHICHFDKMIKEQVDYIIKYQQSIKYGTYCLEHSSFFTYEDGCYVLHPVLKNAVKNALKREPISYQEKVKKRITDWYMNHHDQSGALYYFVENKEYEKAFKLPLTVYHFTFYSDEIGEQLLDKMLYESSVYIKRKYLETSMILAQMLILYDRPEEALQLSKLIQEAIEHKDVAQSEKNQLNAQFTFLEYTKNFGDTKKMLESMKKISSLLNGKRLERVDEREPWGFGSSSLSNLLYQAERPFLTQVEELEKCMNYYTDMTDGHGSGVANLFRGEYYFYTGELEKAEGLAYQAYFEATSKNQESVLINALFCLGRIAVWKGNSKSIKNIMRKLNEPLVLEPNEALTMIREYCYAFLALETGQEEEMASWIIEGNFPTTQLRWIMEPVYFLLYSRMLLEHEKYVAYLGRFEMDLEYVRKRKLDMVEIYVLIHGAIAYEGTSQLTKAEETLKEAINLAMPNKVYVPFCENGGKVLPILRRLEFPHMKKIETLYQKYEKSKSVFNEKEHFFDQCGLTMRERQVAKLAARGDSNKEIAEKLVISEATVKKCMWYLFQKLSISKRSELKGLLQEIEE